jgi:hypothetical protein
MTKRGALMALTNPTADADAEYNRWYNDVHLPDVLRIPGIVRARRYRLADQQHIETDLPWKYLAIYELEHDDLASIAGELADRRGTARMPISAALAEERLAWFFEEIFVRPPE